MMRPFPRVACIASLAIVCATGTTAAQSVTTSWTPTATVFADTANWNTNSVTGNRSMSAQIYHSDTNHPCTPIYQIAITDSSYAAAGGAHKWLSGNGACSFGSGGIGTSSFYVLASTELLSKCQGHTGPLSFTRKLWLSLFSTQSPSPSQVSQQLTQGASYPFISSIDGYKATMITVNLTCVGPPPPPSAPPVLTITSATVKPVSYHGACPANVAFSAAFLTNGVTGGIAVRFDFSDGVSSPTTLYHSSGGGATVSYTRSFTSSTSGDVRANGNEVVAPFVAYSVTCAATTPTISGQKSPVKAVQPKPAKPAL